MHCGCGLALLSPWRLMSNALIHCFYAERAGHGISFGGARYCDVLQWLPLFRPYRSPAELPKQAFIDQCYLVTHVVFTLANWGELSLHPSQLPHEFYFLREHLPWHIGQQVRRGAGGGWGGGGGHAFPHHSAFAPTAPCLPLRSHAVDP